VLPDLSATLKPEVDGLGVPAFKQFQAFG
jgi:hypothetical protein